MQYTTNLNLKKPEYTDTADIQNINDNMDVIDSQLAQMATDNTRLTTAKTITGAINELFTNANNGKQNWVDVIGSPLLNTDTFATLMSKTQTLKDTFATNLTNKGQSASGTESLNSLVGKVANIATGKKFASGTKTATSYTTFMLENGTTNSGWYGAVTVTGLTFQPSIILIMSDIYVWTAYYDAVTLNNGYKTIMGCIDSMSNVRLDGSYAYVTSTSFKMPAPASASISWIAIE